MLFKNEIKTTTIKRRDYISKTLIKFSKSLDGNNFSWITYDNFIEEENNIISKENEFLIINL